MNREFLMLAEVYDPAKHQVNGWYASEKLDGQRAFWDGGLSRGKPTDWVPWANLERKVRPVSTGLWSRYGNVIPASDHWLDKLPKGIFLDGELYCGNLQNLRKIVSRDIPSPALWDEVKYLIFESPGCEVFADGRINNANFKKNIVMEDCLSFLGIQHYCGYIFSKTLATLKKEVRTNKVVRVLEQVQLPQGPMAAKDEVYTMLNGIVESGGEGLILRAPNSFWMPKRIKQLLKVKPMLDSEGIVVGHTEGKNRLVGMLGALVVEWKGVKFELGTGLDDGDRHSKLFPIGTKVRFKYTSLTNDGVPREARFDCIREDE